MEARYMVSDFASNNSDFNLADASNCPPDPHLTVIADSPDERGFKSGRSMKFT
jgi:hypothetical protein